ncbi:MAG: NUDIX domain-containing protein [Candidatus Saccharimonadales bacterium]
MQNRRIAVRGIILDDGKLFAVRLKNYKGQAIEGGQTYWCTPGGGVDVGEPLLVALERELIEETGVKPVIGSLLYIQQFQHKDTEQLEFFFHITNGEDYRHINLAETTHGAIEIEEAAFIDPPTKPLLPVFLTKEDITADTTAGITRYFNNIPE